MLTRQTVGLPGLLGTILLLVWACGFLILGVHSPLFHALVPLAALLLILQGVRRVDLD